MQQAEAPDPAGALRIEAGTLAETTLPDGGYEPGYRACPCFWGHQPASLVRTFLASNPDLSGKLILDAGCGEGKNAAALAQAGASVDALDVSPLALEHARTAWPALTAIHWRLADITHPSVINEQYDVVVAYGLLHCLSSPSTIQRTVANLRSHTARNGYQIVCAFNDRSQDLRAHPHFTPTLLSHDEYLRLYDGWVLLQATDSDLHEEHPDTRIPHHHSMTRILARRQ
jgi:SAM-dependent methyltransferase